MFNSWAITLAKTEDILHKKMKLNPYHPFTSSQPNVYVLSYIHPNLWKGLILFVTSFVGCALYEVFNKKAKDKITGIFILLLLLALWMIFSSIGKRHLILDLNAKVYKFYIAGYLKVQGPLYHIYIRLKAQKNGYGVLLYKLILNGQHIEPQDLTGIRFSEAPEKLEKLGKRMASRLNLNYFDHLDKSYKHVIRHTPPTWLPDNPTIL